MYQVYAFSTPNSVKVPIALEELGLQYELHSVNVRKGEQKHADFVALNPNGKVPVLRDDEHGFTLSESAAILFYLAEHHGVLLAQEPVTRARTFEQLFVHAFGLSPAFGQPDIFCTPRRPVHRSTRWTASRRKRVVNSDCSTRCFPHAPSSRAMTSPSLTSPISAGSGAGHFRTSRWTTRQTCNAGTTLYRIARRSDGQSQESNRSSKTGRRHEKDRVEIPAADCVRHSFDGSGNRN